MGGERRREDGVMWHQHRPVTQILGLSEAKIELEGLVLT